MKRGESDEEPFFCRVVRGVMCVYLRHLERRYEEKKGREAELLLEAEIACCDFDQMFDMAHMATIPSGQVKKYNSKPV